MFDFDLLRSTEDLSSAKRILTHKHKLYAALAYPLDRQGAVRVSCRFQGMLVFRDRGSYFSEQ